MVVAAPVGASAHVDGDVAVAPKVLASADAGFVVVVVLSVVDLVVVVVVADAAAAAAATSTALAAEVESLTFDRNVSPFP